MKTTPTLVDSRCFQFGPYVVDARRRLLWRDGSHVALTPKALEILGQLLHNRTRVVTKEELLDALWPDTAVEENTLTRHISTLRKALEERPTEHHYIVTVPGHGYQFVADVEELDECPPGLRHSVGPMPPPRPAIAAPVPRAQRAAIEAPVREAAREDVPVVAPAVRPVWSRNAVLAVALAILVAGVAVVMIVPLRGLPLSRAHRVLRQVTFDSGLQRQPTWAPDGKSIAYASGRSGNSDIWVQGLADTNPTRVTQAAEDDSQPDWSPNGRWLAFRSERAGGGLYVVPSGGGAERRIASFGYQPSWSPDSTLVLFSSSGHEGGIPKMYVVGLDGGAPQPVRPDLMAGLRALQVAWRPGTHDVSIWARNAAAKWTFLTAPLVSGPAITSNISDSVQRQIDTAGLTLGRFRWLRSGKYLLFEGRSQQVRNLWRVTVDPNTLAWTDGPERLTTGTSDDTDMAVSVDGANLAFSARHARTRVWSFPFDPVGGHLTGAGRPVTSGGAGELDADTPDDGSKLVYRTVRGDRQEIWERSVIDGRERLLISSTGWIRTRPRWSPDGRNIAYLRSRANTSGQREAAAVAILPASGGEERLITGPDDVAMVPTDWSPDGQWILGACRSDPGLGVTTCVMPSSGPSSGSRVRVLASDRRRNMFEQRFSPDQRWITFVAVDAADAGVSTIFAMPATGGRWTPLTDGLSYDDKPHWSADGKTLYYVSSREGLFNVWGRRFDAASGTPTGAPFRVTSLTSPGQTISGELARMQIAVTSQQLFLPITETSGELWTLANIDK